MAQCKHDEKDCKKFDAAEPKTQELPEIEGYEKIKLYDAQVGERVFVEVIRHGCASDGPDVAGVEYPGRPGYRHCSAEFCYRPKPAKIRADEVPDLRKFKDAQGRIHRRVVSAGDGIGGDGTICAPIIHGSTWGSWIKPDTLVTLLPEDKEE